MFCAVAAVHVRLPDTNSSMHARRGSREKKQTCNIAELLSLGLHYQVPWPLSIIVDDTVLQQYNQVLIFLLQVSLNVLACNSAARNATLKPVCLGMLIGFRRRLGGGATWKTMDVFGDIQCCSTSGMQRTSTAVQSCNSPVWQQAANL